MRRIKLAGNHDDDFGDGLGGDVDHENDNADQNLSSAGEGGDMEGDVGEDEEGVSVLGELLQARHVVPGSGYRQGLFPLKLCKGTIPRGRVGDQVGG